MGDDPDLLAKVVPDYPATGKRTLQDNGSWLSCLKKDNVELVRDDIARIVADGLVTTDGTHYPADVICYATGFRHARCASSGVSVRRRTSASRSRTSPTCSACTAPGPTSPTAAA